MPFVVVLFLTMVVMAGMGVDFMRHESARSDLQNALDRGVLAATSRTQTLALAEEGMSDEEIEQAKRELIASYMKSRTFNIAVPDVDVSIPDDLDEDETAVSATADYDLSTFFLKIAGFRNMTVPAASYAEQRRVDIEVAVVLDISGSMQDQSSVLRDETNPGAGYFNKMEAMQEAVVSFVEGLLPDEQSTRQTLISVVPYSGQTSANAFMADFYNLQPPENFQNRHGYSWCFDFNSNTDYETVVISPSPSGAPYRQYQHVVESGRSADQRRYPCPARGADAANFVNRNVILPYSNDVDEITTMVRNLRSELYTSTYTGIKWAAALLDPSSRPLVSALINQSDPDVALYDGFEGWPQNYSDTGVQKYLIIFSDGRNTLQRKITNANRYYVPSDDLTSDAERFEEEMQQYEAWNFGLIDGNNSRWSSSHPPAGQATTFRRVSNYVNGSMGDSLSRSICSAAKSAASGGRLTIFSIGYELDNSDAGTTARGVLQDCSTNPATDFFDIRGGMDPSEAFDEIQSRINRLKLAQAQD
ncbi:Tad domain-containing protein [Algicella marina]|nr:Tad domain-containing protein [Algicella marina]